jgi:hypothetical protein
LSATLFVVAGAASIGRTFWFGVNAPNESAPADTSPAESPIAAAKASPEVQAWVVRIAFDGIRRTPEGVIESIARDRGDLAFRGALRGIFSPCAPLVARTLFAMGGR